MTSADPLADKSLTIVLAYAPAGLGHLRVTDALRHGLPNDAEPILLPSEGESIRVFHRFTSIHPAAKFVMEWFQHGSQEAVFTRFYRRFLRSDVKKMKRQLLTILKQRVELPEKLVIVASHFGIAHQVGMIKKQLAREGGVKVYLIVQVTDDSPQKIWYVPGADLIVVPSEETRASLLAYGKQEGLPPVEIVVHPYPVSLRLGEKIDQTARLNRRQQLESNSDEPLQIAVPVSGAAVGISALLNLMRLLHKAMRRVSFQVVVKKTIYTNAFWHSLSHTPFATVYSSHSDRQIVELYETAYSQSNISLEITKPSEQAFKALYSPSQLGGAILLFLPPVGRQEYDNLEFLRRHGLIPNSLEQEQLLQHLLPESDRIRHWRGLILPPQPAEAVKYIKWAVEVGLLAAMDSSTHTIELNESDQVELATDGVRQFWDEVRHLLK